jgi:sulfane dehydrogenase subunit SoxC
MGTPNETPSSRRTFLRKSAVIAGTALAGAGAAGRVGAAPLEVPPTAQQPGRPIPATAYGMPSKFESHVARRRTDVFVNRQNWSDWSMTPLQHQHGIVTPTGLIFERHHAGIPDIDPATHKLVIHGLVKQPLVFTMSDQ